MKIFLKKQYNISILTKHFIGTEHFEGEVVPSSIAHILSIDFTTYNQQPKRTPVFVFTIWSTHNIDKMHLHRIIFFYAFI